MTEEAWDSRSSPEPPHSGLPSWVVTLVAVGMVFLVVFVVAIGIANFVALQRLHDLATTQAAIFDRITTSAARRNRQLAEVLHLLHLLLSKS